MVSTCIWSGLRPFTVPEKYVVASLSLILICTGFDGTFVYCANRDSKVSKCLDSNIPLLQEHGPCIRLCDQEIWSIPRESALSKVSCSALMKCKLVCFDSELMERIRDETRKDLNNSRFLDFDGSSGDQVPNNFAPSSYRHGQKAPKRVQTQECTEYGSVEGWI